MESVLLRQDNLSCNDPNLSLSDDFWSPPSIYSALSQPIGVILILLFLIGTPSNIFIIVYTIQKHLYVYPTHLFLLNLHITNLLLCVLILPFGILSSLVKEFIFGNSDFVRCQVCKLIGVFNYVLIVSSLHTIALLSLDRLIFVCVSRKYYYNIMNIVTVLVAIALSWFISILVSVPLFFQYGEPTYFISCIIVVDNEAINFNSTIGDIITNIQYKTLTGLESVIVAIILSVNTLWLLCYMFVYSFKQMDPLEKESNEQRKLVTVYLVLLSVFIIAYTPVLLLAFVITVSDLEYGDNVFATLYVISYISTAMNSATNPILLTAMVSKVHSGKNLTTEEPDTAHRTSIVEVGNRPEISTNSS